MKRETQETMEQQVRASGLPAENQEELIAIFRGEKLPLLSRDTIAKKIFSPEEHPERFDFVMQRVMQDPGIKSYHAAPTEGVYQNMYSKKVIGDIRAWLQDGRMADLEMQGVAQDFIFDRTDAYANNMLTLLYSTNVDQKKKEVNYKNMKGIVVVVLMAESPKVFKEFSSDRYIHRVKSITTDTGMEFPTLKQMAFVQLDKALELFLNETYNKDEDIELLKLLATIADINNDSVRGATSGEAFFDDIRDEVMLFSRNKEVQAMLLDEDFARLDWNSNYQSGVERGLEQGREQGLEQGLNALFSLVDQGRITEEEAAQSFNMPLEAFREKREQAHVPV